VSFDGLANAVGKPAGDPASIHYGVVASPKASSVEPISVFDAQEHDLLQFPQRLPERVIILPVGQPVNLLIGQSVVVVDQLELIWQLDLHLGVARTSPRRPVEAVLPDMHRIGGVAADEYPARDDLGDCVAPDDVLVAVAFDLESGAIHTVAWL